jgi:hypothetical protein
MDSKCEVYNKKITLGWVALSVGVFSTGRDLETQVLAEPA